MVSSKDFFFDAEALLQLVRVDRSALDNGDAETDLVVSLQPLVALPTPQEIIEVTKGFSRLLQEAPLEPHILYKLLPREFEEFIAEIWEKLGYKVELTTQTRDGGRDIVAVRSLEVATRILIECKRYEPRRKISVSLVRSLYGVKVHDQATKAVLATTSTFTKDAKAFIRAHPWELEGRDLDGIMEWIKLVKAC
jgi:restriction endonuclease Mrr